MDFVHHAEVVLITFYIQIRNKSPTNKNFGDVFGENGDHVLILSDPLFLTGYTGKAPSRRIRIPIHPPPKSENCLITHEEFHRAEVCGRRDLEYLERERRRWREGSRGGEKNTWRWPENQGGQSGWSLFHPYLEPQTTIYKWMFGETTIFYVKIWNHPIETTIYKWLALGFQVLNF